MATTATAAGANQASFEQMMGRLVDEAAVSLAKGEKRKAIIEGLMARGFSPAAANEIVDRAEALKKAAFRKAGLELFFKGAGLIVLGAIITGGTAAISGSTGGFFIVSTGLFISGVVNVFRGAGRMLVG